MRQRQADADDHQLDDAEALAPQGSPQARVERPARAAPPSTMTIGKTSHIGSANTTPKTSGDDGAEGEHLAVREVAEPGRAVDQRDADGGEGEQQAEVEAVHEAIEELIEERHRHPLAFTEEEVDDLRVGQPELRPPARRDVALDDDAVGEGRLVDGQRVLALLGHVQAPFAVGIRHGLGLEAAAFDGHGHVGHRLVFERDDAGEVEVRLLLVVTGRGMRARRTPRNTIAAASSTPSSAASHGSVRRAGAVVGPTEPPVRHSAHRWFGSHRP